MIFILGVITAVLANAKSLPSTISVAGGWDSTASRTGSVDVEVGIKTWGLVDFGVATTHTQYDDTETKTGSVRFGFRSNPLYDFSGGVQVEYNEFSEQLVSGLLTVPLNYYIGDFAFRLTPGLRVLTVQLAQALQNSVSEVKDESFYGSLEVTYFINRRYSLSVFYSQYSYQNDFTPLTRDAALLFGYLPATVESAAGLLNQSVGLGGSYFYKKFSVSLDLSTSDTEFVDTRLNMATISFGYSLGKRFYLTVAKGWSAVNDSGESYRGDFTNLGMSYTLP